MFVVAAMSSFKCHGMFHFRQPNCIIPNCQYDATGIILANSYFDASGITSKQAFVSRKVERREPDIGGLRVRD